MTHHTEMQIPDDVMQQAVVAFNTAIDMDGYEGSYEVIARAILAERQRCAMIAEDVPFILRKIRSVDK